MNGTDLLASNPELPKQAKRSRSKTKDAGNGNDTSGAELERSIADAPKGKAGKKGRNNGRFLIRVTTLRHRLIDADNIAEKYVIDCCRYAGLLPGDSPNETAIETSQQKAGKEDSETTRVEIYRL